MHMQCIQIYINGLLKEIESLNIMSHFLKVRPALLFFNKDFANNYEPLFIMSLDSQFNLLL